MSRLVCYIPSYNDSDLARESVASSPDWDVVISDNASAEPHRSALAALAGERVQVIRQEESLGRVGNWKFCVEHFRQSGREWMKFLSAGDLHTPNSCDLFRRAIDRFPEIRCIVPRIEIVRSDRRGVFMPTDRECVLSPAQLMVVIVEHGNIFQSLTAPLIHADTLTGGFSFGEPLLSFSADLFFMIGIARRWPAAFITDVTAEFHIERRKGYQAGAFTLEHYLEACLVRLRAGDAFLELTGDRPRRTKLLEHVVRGLHECVTVPLEKLAGDVVYAPEAIAGNPPPPG
jgi:Glycosyl transferase family 2